MVVFINILIAIAAFFYGALWGSIPTGVIIGKVFFGKDPRDFGSGNSGGTNSGRVFGKKVGIIVITLDILKAVIAFWTAWAILRFTGIQEAVSLWEEGVPYNWLVSLGAAIGHCFSPWLKFKGGKAVACFMAAVGGPSWVLFISCFVAFFVPQLIKKIVSASSILSGAILLVLEWVMVILRYALAGSFDFSLLMWNFGAGGGMWFCWQGGIVITLIYILLVIRHHANIKRLLAHEEKQLEWGESATAAPTDSKSN